MGQTKTNMRETNMEDKDYEIFQAKQRALIAESKIRGLKNNLRDRVNLELEGIEDIFEFLKPEEVAPIKERIARIRKIFEEEI